MPPKILVVDDDPVIRTLITEYLAHYGHSVEVLESGIDCLKKIQQNLPDILVLDMLMPGMNGNEVLRNLRDNPLTTKLPVIMLSADRRMANESHPDDPKADRYLEKPVNIKEILQAIGELGSARQQA